MDIKSANWLMLDFFFRTPVSSCVPERSKLKKKQAVHSTLIVMHKISNYFFLKTNWNQRFLISALINICPTDLKTHEKLPINPWPTFLCWLKMYTDKILFQALTSLAFPNPSIHFFSHTDLELKWDLLPSSLCHPCISSRSYFWPSSFFIASKFSEITKRKNIHFVWPPWGGSTSQMKFLDRENIVLQRDNSPESNLLNSHCRKCYSELLYSFDVYLECL